MNRSIEQALLSLLPTHNSALPQSLTELASSLLAQSRHRASTLKAEEEVARLYACAHIACDRLKITLNLPPIDPRPPIPPRFYKRLYNHLEKILPSSSSTPSRATPGRRGTENHTGTPGSRLRITTIDITDSPTARKGVAAPASKASPLPSRVTPGKTKSLAQFRGTPNIAPVQKLSSSEALPPWMRPTLRCICKENGHKNIGPVVMSGVESIVAPKGLLTDDKWVRNHLVALLGALYLYIWRAVKWPGVDLVEKEYVACRNELVGALNKARDVVAVKSATASASSDSPSKRKQRDTEADEAAWEGWHTVHSKDLDAAAVHISRYGWLELDWVKGIDDLVDQAADDGDESSGEGDSFSEGSLQIRRTDTMLQERYDYLSERRMKDYAAWKEGILNRIKVLENAPAQGGVGGEAMDIDDNNA